ncbi:uncharacterized protein V1518DRAFT_180161 [Limtongia smithiae]|uniref:uncharacterized protein n=1 Tax=Limtongia smithiae TaxID=1125753 RepID=UPI0034CECB40
MTSSARFGNASLPGGRPVQRPGRGVYRLEIAGTRRSAIALAFIRNKGKKAWRGSEPSRSPPGRQWRRVLISALCPGLLACRQLDMDFPRASRSRATNTAPRVSRHTASVLSCPADRVTARPAAGRLERSWSWPCSQFPISNKCSSAAPLVIALPEMKSSTWVSLGRMREGGRGGDAGWSRKFYTLPHPRYESQNLPARTATRCRLNISETSR